MAGQNPSLCEADWIEACCTSHNYLVLRILSFKAGTTVEPLQNNAGFNHDQKPNHLSQTLELRLFVISKFGVMNRKIKLHASASRRKSVIERLRFDKDRPVPVVHVPENFPKWASAVTRIAVIRNPNMSSPELSNFPLKNAKKAVPRTCSFCFPPA